MKISLYIIIGSLSVIKQTIFFFLYISSNISKDKNHDLKINIRSFFLFVQLKFHVWGAGGA